MVAIARNVEGGHDRQSVARAAELRVGRAGDPFAGRRPRYKNAWEPHEDHRDGKDFGSRNPSNPSSGV